MTLKESVQARIYYELEREHVNVQGHRPTANGCRKMQNIARVITDRIMTDIEDHIGVVVKA